MEIWYKFVFKSSKIMYSKYVLCIYNVSRRFGIIHVMNIQYIVIYLFGLRIFFMWLNFSEKINTIFPKIRITRVIKTCMKVISLASLLTQCDLITSCFPPLLDSCTQELFLFIHQILQFLILLIIKVFKHVKNVYFLLRKKIVKRNELECNYAAAAALQIKYHFEEHH